MVIPLEHFQRGLDIGLDPNEIVYCIALLSNRELCDKLRERIPELESNLIKKEFVTPDGKNLTELFISTFKFSTENAWEEFKKIYPKSTPNGRRLHDNLKKAKPKYMRLIKRNKQLHEKILNSLNREINDRGLRSSLDFMKGIYTYINQEAWTAYEDDDKNDRNKRISRIKIL